MNEEEGWKGWALGDTALYLDQPPGAAHVGLFLQYANDTRRLAYFIDVPSAQEAQVWLDAALTAVGLANSELAALLGDERG